MHLFYAKYTTIAFTCLFVYYKYSAVVLLVYLKSAILKQLILNLSGNSAEVKLKIYLI